MTELSTEPDVVPRKRSIVPLLIGVVLAIAAGAGGFLAAQSGLLGLGGEKEEKTVKTAGSVFVPVDPLIISLGSETTNRHLRFLAQLEVDDSHASEVEKIMPRIVDVLNGYLRAVNMEELEDPAVLIKLRAQMLRRVQMVSGEGRVRDLLIMEFVLN